MLNSDEEIKARLHQEGFYEIFSFYKKTGIITNTRPYGYMSELHREMTKTEQNRKGKRLDTGCSGCIANAFEMIYNRWPL